MAINGIASENYSNSESQIIEKENCKVKLYHY